MDFVEPDYDEQLLSYIKVYDGISFRDIADATGIDYEVVKNLNPGFRRDYVPPTTDGYYVILPERVMPAFVRYLNSLGNRSYSLESSDNFVNSNIGDGRYWHSLVNVQQPESIDNFAQKLGCNGDHLKTWNNLESNYVYSGQSLKIWHPVYVQKHSAIRIDAPDKNVATKPRKNEPAKPPLSSPQAIAEQTVSNRPVSVNAQNDGSADTQYQFHTVRRNESLEDIARQYATSVESLRKLNNATVINVGMRLKIREY